MNDNNKNTYLLQNLVSDFEVLIERGEIGNYNKEEFLQLINFYRDKCNIQKSIEIVDLAIEQYKYITDFYIVKGDLLLEINNPELALKYISHCENISPYAFDVKILQAKAYAMMGDIDVSNALLDELKSFSNLNFNVEVNIIRSYIYEHLGEYEEMFNLLKETLIIDPLNKEALKRINTATIFTKKYEESIDFHKKLIDSIPYNHLAWFNVGQIYTVLSEYEEAIDSLEYSFLINPDFEDGYLEYADLCNQIGKYQKATIVYEEYLDIFDGDSELYTNLIYAHLKLKNLDNAEKFAIEAIKTDSYNDEAFFLLGQVYRSRNKWEKALNAFHKAIDIESDREEYFEALAEMYIKLNDNKKAEKFFDIIMSMDTPEEQYYIKYIRFLLSIKKYDKAYNIIEKSEDIVYSPLFNYLKSIIYFKADNKKEALLILDSALEDSYEDHDMLFELAPELKNDKEVTSIINYYKS